MLLRYLRYTQQYAIARFLLKKPVMLTHFLTSRCNCRCRMCDIWTKKPMQEMPTDQVKRVLGEARRLGFAAYVMWGGEPLLRPDAIEILSYARELGFYTSLITNGTLLPKKAAEIASAVDLTWVSIDHPSRRHDTMRSRDGTYAEALEGIRRLKNLGGKVALNSVLSKLNFEAGVCKEIAVLARRFRVRVAFDPMEVFPGFNDAYALSSRERVEAFSEVMALKKAGYPVLNSYEFLKHQIQLTPYSCVQPRVFLNVRENGVIEPFWCRKNSGAVGDLQAQSLSEILHSTAYKEFVKACAGCGQCVNSVTVETSFFYKPETFIFNCLRLPSPILEFISFYGGLSMPNTRYAKARDATLPV